MIKNRVSVVIPARNERFLQATIDSLLAGATGDVEILACLDGYWPDPPLREDPRVRQLHWSEAQGMRPCENVAARVATGEFLMKIDAHCLIAPGWDDALKADCDSDSLVVPTRHSIDGERWRMKPRNYNYHILTYPYLPSMYGEGLHAITFPWDQNKTINEARAHLLTDDLMSFQGSCWFQHTKTFLADGPLDHERFYFYGESQETGLLRFWLCGRRCVINKKTWYAHYHKGRDNRGADGRLGRGFYLDLRKKRRCESEITNICVNNAWPCATRTFESLVEHFWPLISEMKDPRYAWPKDWYNFDKYRTWFCNRSADQLPAHI